MDEPGKVAERYEKRKSEARILKHAGCHDFNYFMQHEREAVYSDTIKARFPEAGSIKFIEIGAGTGENLPLFLSLGILPENMVANELLPDRAALLRISFPGVRVLEGDATSIDFGDELFTVVFQSTVFTSLLDAEFKKELADKMWSILKPGGIILWYDFIYDNPQNPDVKGVKAREVRRLFPHSDSFIVKRVTLAPPIGRRIGKSYPLVNNLFPFFRSHIVAVLSKKM